MSTLTTTRRPARRREPCQATTLLDGPAGGEPTLDALVSGVWEGLAAHHPAACPLCDGTMTPVYGAHAAPIGGRCGSCHAVLA